MKKIDGYKSFDTNYRDISGNLLEAGKKYHVDGIISYGINGNGFHFAKKLEDTLRYQITDNKKLVNPPIAQVIGSGTIKESNKTSDEYYGYYNSYVTSDIEIIKYLTREEIINYALKLDFIRLQRFISLYKLTDEEMKLFKGKSIFTDLAILYYQKEIINIYELYYSNSDKVKKLIRNI